MNTATSFIENATYRERLQQAKRVMEGLSEEQRSNNFSIHQYAVQSDHGVVACIGGHCGLDPWFQERGFFTNVQNNRVSMYPEDFFGTDRPFYSKHYPNGTVTFEDAIAALDRAIASLADAPSDLATAAS